MLNLLISIAYYTKMADYILGILGSHGKITQTIIIDSVINPSFEEFGTPVSILLPSEGDATLYIENYIEKKFSSVYLSSIPFNWQSYGISARNIRDSHIINECTHFIIFLGKTSKYYEKLAEKLVRRGKKVITVSYIDYELTCLEPESIPTQNNSKKKTSSKNGRFIDDYFVNTT